MRNILILFVFLFLAAVLDYKFGRIPNRITLSAYLTGIGYIACFYPDMLVIRILTSIAILLLLYLFFSMSMLGAGDIKLLMMISIFMEAKILAELILIAAMFSVVTAIARTIRNKKGVVDFLKVRVHMAVPIFISYCVILIKLYFGG